MVAAELLSLSDKKKRIPSFITIRLIYCSVFLSCETFCHAIISKNLSKEKGFLKKTASLTSNRTILVLLGHPHYTKLKLSLMLLRYRHKAILLCSGDSFPKKNFSIVIER